jgi:membrane-bound lytic murein transglycosylase B
MKLFWALLCALLVTGTTAAAGMAEPPPAESGTPVSTAYADAAAEHGFFWQLFLPQTVLPGSFLYALPADRSRRSEGTRSDQQFFEISSTGSNDVPDAALRAYKHAAATMAKTDPGCHVSWTMLAAIGRVESNHGRFGGAVLGSDGVSRPAIVGPRLDGAGPFAAIADSDGGKLDGDRQWDRAIGQMQFLPQTWASVARDGDGDGVANPGDLDDSALGAAVYLCGAGDLSTDAGMARAAFRYNHSDYYVALVLSFAHGYATGVFVQPTPPPPPGQDNKAAQVVQAAATSTPKPGKPAPAKPAATAPAKPVAPAPSTPGGSGAGPGSTPTPTPSTPSPSAPPQPEDGDWTGQLQVRGDGFVLGDWTLDLDGRAGDAAAADWDGDGTVGSVKDELTGLDGRRITVHGAKLSGTVTYARFVEALS